MKDFFIYLMQQSGISAYGGKANGQYAGWTKNNLNQLFRKWHQYADKNVHSMQLEFTRSLRDTNIDAKFAGDTLAMVLYDLINHNYWTPSGDFKTNEI